MAKKAQRALEPPHMTILSDHPILRVDEEKERREPDSFTLHSRFGAVYDIIRHRNTRPPLAIAVYGDWGTGKTSCMRWLADRLGEWSQRSKTQREGHHRARTVWFDPWKYTKREDVWRGLIAEVILNAIDIRKASLPTVLSAARKFGPFLGRPFLNVLSSAELTVGAKEVGGEARVDLDALAKFAEDQRQTARPEKAFLNEFECALREWVKSSLADDERMVIFIDDLDRCLPEVVLEVLEALKLYLNIPQLVFVIGLDREVVDAMIKHHYKEYGLGEAKAEHYLDKMFQVEVDIPPTQTQMEGYLPRQIEAMNQVTDGYWSRNLTDWNPKYRQVIENKIAALAKDNPREVKRLLNSTLLRGAAAAPHEALGGSEAQRFTQGCQVYLMQCVLRKHVPQSARLLREQRSLVFFQCWSRLRQLFPDIGPSGTPAPDESPDAASEYEALRAALPRYRDTNEAYPLLDRPDLWDLLAIPFSAEVAAAAVIDNWEAGEAERSPPVETPCEADARPESGHLANVPQSVHKPRVFISHSSKDKEFARKLVDRLEQEKLEVWFDEQEIGVGDSIVARINEGLRQADYLVIVLSPHSVNAPWVEAELNAVLMSDLTRKGTAILPVLIAECDIPPLLRDRLYADFRAGFEPGIRKLLEALQLEAPAELPLDEPARVGSERDCVRRLRRMRLGELRRRLTAGADRVQVRKIWLDVFEEDLNEQMPNQGTDECVIRLLSSVKKRKLEERLYESMCNECPWVARE